MQLHVTGVEKAKLAHALCDYIEQNTQQVITSLDVVGDAKAHVFDEMGNNLFTITFHANCNGAKAVEIIRAARVAS